MSIGILIFWCLGFVCIFALGVILKPKPLGYGWVAHTKVRTKKVKIRKESKPSSALFSTMQAKSFCQRANKVGWKLQEHEYYMIVGGGIVFGFLVGLLLENTYVQIGLALMFLLLPGVILDIMTEKYHNTIRNQLEPFVSSVASSFNLQGNVRVAFEQALPMAQDPIKTEFQRAMQKYEMGESLASVFEEVNKDIPVKEMRFFTSVVVIAEEAGGKANIVMQKVVNKIQNQKILNQELETALSAIRRDTRFLAIVVFAFILATRLFLKNDLWTSFESPLGNLVLAAIVFANLGVLLLIQKRTKMPD